MLAENKKLKKAAKSGKTITSEDPNPSALSLHG